MTESAYCLSICLLTHQWAYWTTKIITKGSIANYDQGFSAKVALGLFSQLSITSFVGDVWGCGPKTTVP